MTRGACWLVLLVLLAGSCGVAFAQTPDLVVLTETGEERDGLPVFQLHPEPEEALAGLRRGLSGTFVRVYRMQQRYLQTLEGIEPEPAYVLLSSHQGGFGRFGFFLGDQEKRDAGYVDVHRDWPISGEFGAVDQVFPHELAHVMRQHLVGDLADGRANQVHALGVRTDRVVAFNEGFAEHLQAVAFAASPDVAKMSELAAERAPYDAALRHLDAYRHELTARLAVATRMRMGFLAWYSNDEDVLRYFAVRDNAFAREPDLPEHLLRRDDPYPAYLLESVLPGAPDGRPKSLSRMLASEGVVAALFYRWALDERIGGHRRSADFYQPFGVPPDDISDLENTYLKLSEVFYLAKPQSALEVIDGYRQRFPDEAQWVDDVADQVFLGARLEAPAELWLANRSFATGTTLFDQYRGLRRVHTFDLNAASLVDLVSVPGVELETARAIRQAGPWQQVRDLERVPGLPPELVEQFVAMEDEMQVLLAELESAAETEDSLSVSSLLMPYVWRLVLVVAISMAVGAVLYRQALLALGGPERGWPRSLVNGLAAALLGIAGSWALGTLGLGAFAAVAAWGLPAAGIQRLRHGPGGAWAVLAGWLAAALPAAVLTTPWI